MTDDDTPPETPSALLRVARNTDAVMALTAEVRRVGELVDLMLSIQRADRRRPSNEDMAQAAALAAAVVEQTGRHYTVEDRATSTPPPVRKWDAWVGRLLRRGVSELLLKAVGAGLLILFGSLLEQCRTGHLLIR